MTTKLLAGAAAAVALSYVSFQRSVVSKAAAVAQKVPFDSYSVVPKTLQLLAPLDSGYPSAELGVHFDIVSSDEPLRVTRESLKPHHVLVKVLCMSADPYVIVLFGVSVAVL